MAVFPPDLLITLERYFGDTLSISPAFCTVLILPSLAVSNSTKRRITNNTYNVRTITKTDIPGCLNNTTECEE